MLCTELWLLHGFRLSGQAIPLQCVPDRLVMGRGDIAEGLHELAAVHHTEPNGLAARLMPRPMMNAHPTSTVARPMANANGRQSLMFTAARMPEAQSSRQKASTRQ